MICWCSIATLGVARQIGLEPVVVVVVVVSVWASVDALADLTLVCELVSNCARKAGLGTTGTTKTEALLQMERKDGNARTPAGKRSPNLEGRARLGLTNTCSSISASSPSFFFRLAPLWERSPPVPYRGPPCRQAPCHSVAGFAQRPRCAPLPASPGNQNRYFFTGT